MRKPDIPGTLNDLYKTCFVETVISEEFMENCFTL